VAGERSASAEIRAQPQTKKVAFLALQLNKLNVRRPFRLFFKCPAGETMRTFFRVLSVGRLPGILPVEISVSYLPVFPANMFWGWINFFEQLSPQVSHLFCFKKGNPAL